MKRRLSHCPQCNGSRTVPQQVKAVRKDKDGKDEVYTETVQVDCPTCDGSGTVVDFG